MHRRNFLHSVAGLILWPTGTDPTPIITDFEDGGFLIDVGCLRCCLCQEFGGSILSFVPWITDHPKPGMVRERRMAPSTTLKNKLEQVGFPTEFEGDERWPSLVACITHFITPNEIAAMLQRVLWSADWHLLYHDPESGD